MLRTKTTIIPLEFYEELHLFFVALHRNLVGVSRFIVIVGLLNRPTTTKVS